MPILGVRLCVLAGVLACAGGRGMADPPPLIPAPAQASYTDQWLPLRAGLAVVVPAGSPGRVREIAGVLCDELRQRSGLDAAIVSGPAPAAGAIVLTLAPGGLPADVEAYALHISRNVEVRATDPRGLLWGVQTLLQSIEFRADRPGLRCGTLADRPAREWRALMLDPARSFLGLDYLRHTIRLMSAYKLNVLHLHLVDDQAWRFESKAFPKCNPPGEPLYTQAQLRELAAFARRYGVEIVPEFDFPGHSRAAVIAYPDLDCEGKVRAVNEALMCGGKTFTLEFIDRIVGEAAEVFPSPYIHLGADEPFALKRWADCPDCRRRMKEKQVTTIEALYHGFVIDLESIVRKHGKKMIVWNDAFHPGVAPLPPKDLIIDAWLNYENAEPWAAAGYTLINSSTGPLYLTSFGLREGLPLAAVRAWNSTLFAAPKPKRGDQTVRYRKLSANATLLGGQACAWGTEQGMIDRRLFPRLISIAESLWMEDRAGSLADFESRLHPVHDRLLRTLGAFADEAEPAEALFDGGDTAAWTAMGAPAFAVGDGVLAAVGGPAAGWLRSRKAYQSFVLTFDRWSPRSDGETGISFGCAPGGTGVERPDGRAVSAAPAPGFMEVPSLFPAGQWNSYELVVRGRLVTLTVNGFMAWSVADPAQRAGAIGLCGREGDRFRAVRIRPLRGSLLP